MLESIYVPPGSLQNIPAVGAASANTTIVARRLNSIYLWCTTADIQYRVGLVGDAATALDPILPANTGRIIPIDGMTYLYVRAMSGSGHIVYFYPVQIRRAV
jgi:hypothetical protein